MNIDLKKYSKKLISENNSSTVLIYHKRVEQQEKFVEQMTSIIMNLPTGKPYKSLPDVFGIWPENISGKTIKIDQIHEFIRKTQLRPFNSKYKVGVIISSEKMTKEAQNALLKTLEEPADNTFLLLTTANPKKLLPTIISRCQVLEFYEQEDDTLDTQTLQKILRSSLPVRFEFIEKIINEKNSTMRFEKVDSFLNILLAFYREKLINERDTSSVEKIQLIEMTQNAIAKNVNLRLAMENLMINL